MMNLTQNNAASVAKYRRHAAGYDASCGPTQGIRAQAIALLQLQSGDTVLDVGCGTGMSFEPLLQRIGPGGTLLAFEQSPEMLAQAQARVEARGWTNVRLALCNAERYQPPRPPQAVLMHYVHDITRTDAAVAQLFGQLAPGTRLALAGMKYFGGWLAPLNWLAYLKNRPYNVLATDMHQPWDKVARHVPQLAVHPTQWGMGYLAHGVVASPQGLL